MPPRDFKPGSPEDWLARAKSNLISATKPPRDPDFFLEDACFNAQQSAEKAIKAVLTGKKIKFSHTHDLMHLLNLLFKHGCTIPDTILQAGRLTEYAVESRYPPSIEEVNEEDYHEALKIAEQVYSWAEGMIKKNEK